MPPQGCRAAVGWTSVARRHVCGFAPDLVVHVCASAGCEHLSMKQMLTDACVQLHSMTVKTVSVDGGGV